MKLEKDYAVIENSTEAGELVDSNFVETYEGEKRFCFEANEIVTREEILEAITPAEGDAVFYWEEGGWSNSPTRNSGYIDKWTGKGLIDLVYIKATALTIGKTVGELRELLTWAKGKE